MRQFYFDITQAIQNGLLKGDRVLRNEPYLLDIVGFEYANGRVKRMNAPITLPEEGHGINGVFPQMFNLQSGIYAIDENSISLLSIPNGTLSPLAPQGISGEAYIISDPGIEHIHIADFPDGWYGFSNQRVIKCSKGVVKLYDKQIETGCTHKGRTLFGGVSTDILADWNNYIFDIAEFADAPSSFIPSVSEGHIFWTSPGSSDMLRFILDTAQSAVGENPFDEFTYTTNSYESEIVETLKRGTVGFTKVGKHGTVLRIVTSNNLVVVCTTEGNFIYKFTILEGITALSLVGMFGRPIPDESFAFQGNNTAIVIDEDGELYIIRDKVEKLGFGYFLKSMLSGKIVISYSDTNNRFFIANADVSYMLEEDRLVRVNLQGVSVLESADTLYSIGTDINAPEASVRTSYFDFNELGHKTLTEAHVFGDWDGQAKCRVHWKARHTDVARVTGWHRINDQGWVALRCAGKYLSVEVKFEDNTFADIDGLRLAYQVDDKRFRRGIDAGTFKS